MIGIGRTLLNAIQSNPDEYSAPEVIPAGTQAAAVADFIAQRFDVPVTIMGLSYGGPIAALVAKHFPELSAGVIPVAPYTRDMIEIHNPTWSFWAQNSGFMAPFVRSYDEIGRQRLLRSTFEDTMPDVLEGYGDQYLLNLYALEKGVRDLVLVDILSEIEVPVDLLAAKNDKAIPLSEQREAYQAVPTRLRGSFKALPDSHHNLILVDAERAIRWLMSVLSKR